jgi:hypothetical protein
MIRLTTALLALGVSMATVTTSIAQWQNECFYGSCNPEASWCRLLCGPGPQYQDIRSPWYHRHARHHYAKHRHANHHHVAARMRREGSRLILPSCRRYYSTRLEEGAAL